MLTFLCPWGFFGVHFWELNFLNFSDTTSDTCHPTVSTEGPHGGTGRTCCPSLFWETNASKSNQRILLASVTSSDASEWVMWKWHIMWRQQTPLMHSCAMNIPNTSFLFSIYLSIELSSKSPGVLAGKWVTLVILLGSKKMKDTGFASELVIYQL